MGNRAVVQFGKGSDALGIYLHWNGGEESVQAFLDAAKHYEVRTDDYGVARLTQIICNFFGGTLSVGVSLAKNLDRDNGDNGTFIVKDWEIVEKLYAPKHLLGQEFDKEYYDGVFKQTLERNNSFFTKEVA